MLNRFSTAAAALAFIVACSSNHSTDDTSDPTGPAPDTGDQADPGADPGAGSAGDPGTNPGTGSAGDPGSEPDPGTPPVAACPIGTASWATLIGPAWILPDPDADIAVDASGNVLLAARAERPGDASGLTKLSPKGEVIFSKPFGTVVATDAAGNAYVAGIFTAPIDLGLGELQPFAKNDVFVAKLDAAGNVVLARALHLCGCGEGDLQSIAVDATTGRIAVSGTLIGTAVLEANGDLAFMVAPAGNAAFNSRGELIIAGSFTAALDFGDGPIDPSDQGFVNKEGFVAAVDATGKFLWHQHFDGGDVRVTGVAIDAADDIAVVGYTTGHVVLFGEDFHVISAPESGRVTGAFAVELDATGSLIWKRGQASGVEANGVAVNASGAVIAAGATTGNAGFDRIPLLSDPAPAAPPMTSVILTTSAFPASGYARYVDLAFDACGSLYGSIIVSETASAGSPINLYVQKM